MRQGALKSLFTLAVLAAAASSMAQVPSDVTLDALPGISGLSGALGLKNADDGSGRLFIVQQNGIVRILDEDGTLLPDPFVDIGSRTAVSASERGLLDIAFHPQFAVNGRFYLHYSAGPVRPAGVDEGDTVVGEFSITGDPDVANNSPDRIILTVRQDFANHNGGQMRFGPDGYLYLGLGDGGSGNDPCDRAQTLDPASIVTGGSCESDRSVALLGKMLRIDVDTPTPAGSNNLCAANSDGSAEYSIPPTNPFEGETNRCGEVFLYGLRNPWRWSFDRTTGDLWIGDVGQNTTEEVSLLNWPLAGGDDLGWKICEGSTERGSSTTPCENLLPDSVIPVLEYPTGATFGRSITGGYRYRGPVTSMKGLYVFGDAVSGNIWFANESGSTWTSTEFPSPVFSVRSFGQDEQGNLYVVSGSAVHRFNGNIEQIFADGFEGTIP
ncbi:PQQ-dependent sugar dehydrogenase [Wenzhouxiangella sp. XN79A]|uniref:PQQ-dependent sugar dehydrogenase n=1 Tax=Wenzhouxiangella sp. XN79A TaxID=2724193 RepID=UPI00144A52D2|nr:PQQ-dependent sugar dehydrogenase [Wenzhouxiangella sp. XN79A]NKI33951.1 PQQ-dependent sugar dehydrogenase [Wenzhouxiangella sp. XN79A]